MRHHPTSGTRRLSHSTTLAGDVHSGRESEHVHLIAKFQGLLDAITEVEDARTDLHRALANFQAAVTTRNVAHETLSEFLRTCFERCA